MWKPVEWFVSHNLLPEMKGGRVFDGVVFVYPRSAVQLQISPDQVHLRHT